MRFLPLLLLSGCAHALVSTYQGGAAPVSSAQDAAMVRIPPGPFIKGSTPREREAALAEYEAATGSQAARRGRWFDREEPRSEHSLPGFAMDLTPVTQEAFAEFLHDTGRDAPRVERATWQRQGFVQPYEREVARMNWRNQRPPTGRERHPVVLVTHKEASDYCRWRGTVVGGERRLPTALEFEKAARGEQGENYPFGPTFDASLLNSAIGGPRDTVPVGSFPRGASPYGILGLAGNVFQWTETFWRNKKERMTVKGSAWDDGPGVGRGASQHGRRPWIRHVLVGFRCVAPESPEP